MIPQPKSDPATIRKRVTVVSVLLIIAGVVLSGGVLAKVFRMNKAPGVVTAVGDVAFAGGGYPVDITFTDAHGTEHRFNTRTQRKNLNRLTTGQHVEVIYNKDNPAATAEVNQVTRVWLWPGLCFLSGILFLAFRGPLSRA